MTRKEIAVGLGLALLATGASMIIAAASSPAVYQALLFWPGLALTSVSGIAVAWALVHRNGSQTMPAGDTYNNNGNNFGHIGPNNFFGKQPFNMTNDVMGGVLRALGDHGLKAVSIGWIGTQKSHSAAAMLIPYLQGNGIDVTDAGGCMMRMPPNEVPIMIDPAKGEIWIDAEK